MGKGSVEIWSNLILFDKKRAEVGDCTPICSIDSVKLFLLLSNATVPSSPLHQHSNTNCQNWLEEQIIAFSSGHLEGQNSCPVKPDLEQLREAAGEL